MDRWTLLPMISCNAPHVQYCVIVNAVCCDTLLTKLCGCELAAAPSKAWITSINSPERRPEHRWRRIRPMHTTWISKTRGPAQPCSKKVLVLTKEDQGERYVKGTFAKNVMSLGRLRCYIQVDQPRPYTVCSSEARQPYEWTST